MVNIETISSVEILWRIIIFYIHLDKYWQIIHVSNMITQGLKLSVNPRFHPTDVGWNLGLTWKIPTWCRVKSGINMIDSILYISVCQSHWHWQQETQQTLGTDVHQHCPDTELAPPAECPAHHSCTLETDASMIDEMKRVTVGMTPWMMTTVTTKPGERSVMSQQLDLRMDELIGLVNLY